MRILLVDDNSELAFTLKELLELKGFEAEYAIDGFGALEKFKEDNFDLVIMDIVMPGMNGIEVLKRMREIKKDIRVIFVSAFIDEKKREEFEKIGIRSFLEKPYDFQKIINEIEKLLFDGDKKKEAYKF